MRELVNRVVELLAHHEIDLSAILERPFRQHADVRSDKGNLDLGIDLPDLLDQPNVAGEARSAGKQNEKLVIPGNFNGLFRRHVMRRGIEQSSAFEHSGRVSKPDRVPITFNFASGRPTRTGTSV